MTLFVGQLKDFFGLSIASVPSGFVDKVIAYATNISTINWTATAVGAAAIVIMLLWPKVTDKIPGSLIAIIVTTAVVYFADLPVNTIGSVYGELSACSGTVHETGAGNALTGIYHRAAGRHRIPAVRCRLGRNDR